MKEQSIEQEIINYIEKFDKKDYEEIIRKDNRIEIIQIFSKLRENIISWYCFEENSTILEIGADWGQITEILSKSAKKVVSVEESSKKREAILKRHKDIENLEIIDNIDNIQEKFDYITLIGIEKTKKELKDLLISLKDLLNDNGKILITVDNKIGMSLFTSINDNEEEISNISNEYIYTLNELEEQIKKAGFKNQNTYYPMPDYKLTNVIYTEENPLSISNITRNITYNEEDAIKLYKQNDVYMRIIKDDIIKKYLMNTFFIEIYNGEYQKKQAKFVAFSNIRKPEYRIKTIIKENFVYKYPASDESKQHIQNVKNNIDIIKKSNLNTLDSYDDEKIISSYTTSETLDKVILSTVKEDKKIAINLIKKFKQELLDKLEQGNSENNVFDKYNIEYGKETIQDEFFIKYGFWDLIFQNCFYIDNEFYLYDQEWMEENIPINFIFYRAVKYFDGIKRYISEDELYDILDINNNIVSLFEKLDNKLQEEIRDKTIWKIHTQGKTLLDLKREKLTDNNTINLLRIENNKKEEIINQQNAQLHEKDLKIEELNEKLNYIYNSKSWKITAPLRKLKRIK